MESAGVHRIPPDSVGECKVLAKSQNFGLAWLGFGLGRGLSHIYGLTCESSSSTSRIDAGCLRLAVVDCDIVVVVAGQVPVGVFFTAVDFEVKIRVASESARSRAAW